MTDTDVRGRLPAQPSTTDLNLWLVSRLKGEGSELTFGQIASIAKDLSAALRTPVSAPVSDELLAALKAAHDQLHHLLSVFVPDTDGAHATTARVMAQARSAIAEAEATKPRIETAAESDVAKSLADMIIEWVEGGLRAGTDWRNGLASIIAKRLAQETRRNCRAEIIPHDQDIK